MGSFPTLPEVVGEVGRGGREGDEDGGVEDIGDNGIRLCRGEALSGDGADWGAMSEGLGACMTRPTIAPSFSKRKPPYPPSSSSEYTPVH
jgi:hypothetical protein